MKALLRRLRELLRRPPTGDTGAESAGEAAAHPAEDEPETVHPCKRNLKQWYTSHWDWDYMPRAEMEKLLEDEGGGTSRDGKDKD
jgi:hypothetical protein